jgi:peptide/nickel transport system permease protein
LIRAFAPEGKKMNENPAPHPSAPWREAAAMFARNPPAMFGLALLGAIVLLSAAGPLLYRIDPFDMAGAPFAPPFSEGAPILGTDAIGRDILAGIIQGGRTTILVGLISALITCIIGVGVGAAAGYYGGLIDAALSRVTEFFQVLPPLLFAMVIVAIFPPKILTIAAAIGVVSWPGVARLTRAEFLRIKEIEYVAAARAASAADGYLILRVILPNALPPLIIAATLTVASAILFESGLSFLGLSDPNIMSWGLMIGNGREHVFTGWWMVGLPGFAIFIAALAVSLVGDGLNDALNPKLRER